MRLQGMTVLTDDDCARIHQATLQVLERTGVKVLNERGRRLLQDAGARVEGEIVYIPPALAERALQSAPKAVPVYDRCGKLVMDLRDRNYYFGAGGPTPKYCEETTGEMRPFVLRDCALITHVCDACEQIDFNMAMAHSSDVPVQVRDLYEIAVMIRNSPKPIVFTANSTENLRELAAIFQAAGSGGDIKEKPYGIYYTEPISPLTHAPDSLEKAWVAADAGFPLLYTPAPMAGATGPATLAGNIVVGNAEWLSGLIMVQLHKPGAPVIYGGVFAGMDYQTMILAYGAPELQLQTVAVAEMGRYYGIPSFGTAGCSDASTSDPQSTFEGGISILLNAMAGANLIHDVGWLASAGATSAEQLVINNEMIAQCRRIMGGIQVNDETLAVGVIDEVVRGGSLFVDADHTFEHFRGESYFPRLWDRRPLAKREVDDPSLVERASMEVQRLLREYQPAPLDEGRTGAVDAILKRNAAGIDAATIPSWLDDIAGQA